MKQNLSTLSPPDDIDKFLQKASLHRYHICEPNQHQQVKTWSIGKQIFSFCSEVVQTEFQIYPVVFNRFIPVWYKHFSAGVLHLFTFIHFSTQANSWVCVQCLCWLIAFDQVDNTPNNEQTLKVLIWISFNKCVPCSTATTLAPPLVHC